MNPNSTMDRVRNFLDKEVGTGSTMQDIAEAETKLGVVFPLSYREFLRHFGWARFRHQELYGLGAGVPSCLELVRNTLAERNEMQPQLPQALVPVMNDGAGNHYCLDTQRLVGGECPVVFWDHELGSNQSPNVEAPSFAKWLMDLLERLSTP